VPYTKAITDVTGTSSRRRNFDTPVGYPGREALRRKKCDMATESRNIGRRSGY
jgi:hypothetical protein